MTEIVKKAKAPAKPKSSPPKTGEAETTKVAKKAASAVPAKPRGKTAKAAEVTGKVTPSTSTGPQEVPQRIKAVEEKTAATPSREQIAQLAHRFWKERGGHHGSHEQDWFRAERELRGMAS